MELFRVRKHDRLVRANCRVVHREAKASRVGCSRAAQADNCTQIRCNRGQRGRCDPAHAERSVGVPGFRLAGCVVANG